MVNKKDIKRFIENWQNEIDSVSLYNTLSECEKNLDLSKIYGRLADVEAKHAHFWEEKIKEAGAKVPARNPSFRSRLLSFLVKKFGPGFVLPAVTTLEKAGRNAYDNQADARHTHLPRDEHSHARLLNAISQNVQQGVEGGTLARLEGRHRSIGGNALRAAVLGANDGLVSNLSLIMGVAGAALDNHVIILTGLAGLLAGSASMAMGEWLSVQSSRELYQKQIRIEEIELRESPKEEEEELALIYEAKGIPKEEAKALAASIIRDEKNALKNLVREELGIDMENLGGSAWEAAGMSFLLFTLGAVIPLAPFIVWQGSQAVLASVTVSAIALFLVGALITLLTGRSVLFSGMRQLLIGLSAAALTYGIGKWMGVTISG